MSEDVKQLLNRHAEATEAYLLKQLPRAAAFDDVPPRLVEAINYSLLAGGKRLRPALVLETASALGAGATDALPAAAAVELIHTFSLVHDDLPAMDDDDLRRGRPTNHKVFGEAMAILAGDAMTTLAFELLGSEYAGKPSLGLALVTELSRAAGPVGMIGGQVLDMATENQALALEALQNVHHRKTGALIACACRMGALVAGVGESEIDAITRYGRHLGLAFQIADDLLDVTASAEATGKATHKDAAAGKNTYPALLGIDGARQAAREQAEQAVATLESLGASSAGLAALARFSVERGK